MLSAFLVWKRNCWSNSQPSNKPLDIPRSFLLVRVTAMFEWGGGYHVEEEHVKVLKSGVEMLATAMLGI